MRGERRGSSTVKLEQLVLRKIPPLKKHKIYLVVALHDEHAERPPTSVSEEAQASSLHRRVPQQKWGVLGLTRRPSRA